MVRWILLWVSLVAFYGCSKKSGEGSSVTPEKTLSTYVQTFFAMENLSDRQKLGEFLTGEAAKRMSQWSEQDFNFQVTGNKKKFSKLKIIDQRFFGEDQANLTYEIEYTEVKTGAKVSQKKLALLKKEGDQWRIRDARNLSQFIEFPETEAIP